jgi:hypothetical protein
MQLLLYNWRWSIVAEICSEKKKNITKVALWRTVYNINFTHETNLTDAVSHTSTLKFVSQKQHIFKKPNTKIRA